MLASNMLHTLPIAWLILLACVLAVLIASAFRRREKPSLPKTWSEEDPDDNGTLVKDVRAMRRIDAPLPVIGWDDHEEEDDDDIGESCPVVPIAFDYEALDDEATEVKPLFRLDA